MSTYLTNCFLTVLFLIIFTDLLAHFTMCQPGFSKATLRLYSGSIQWTFQLCFPMFLEEKCISIRITVSFLSFLLKIRTIVTLCQSIGTYVSARAAYTILVSHFSPVFSQVCIASALCYYTQCIVSTVSHKDLFNLCSKNW